MERPRGTHSGARETAMVSFVPQCQVTAMIDHSPFGSVRHLFANHRNRSKLREIFHQSRPSYAGLPATAQAIMPQLVDRALCYFSPTAQGFVRGVGRIARRLVARPVDQSVLGNPGHHRAQPLATDSIG
jgi:hypothetical protein